MKLIDILIAADFEWDERYGFAAQDSDGGVWLFLDKPRLMGNFAPVWLAYGGESIALADDLASDYRTAVITRDEYLSAREAAKPKGHPHAAIMAEYAEVARTNPEPWLEFECKDEVTGLWHAFAGNPAWVTRIEHRRKTRTIRINGFEIEPSCAIVEALDSHGEWADCNESIRLKWDAFWKACCSESRSQ